MMQQQSSLSETDAKRDASESSLDFLPSFDKNLDIMCFALGGDKDPSKMDSLDVLKMTCSINAAHIL